MGCSAPVEKYIFKMVRKVHFIDEKLKFIRMKEFICMEDTQMAQCDKGATEDKAMELYMPDSMFRTNDEKL